MLKHTVLLCLLQALCVSLPAGEIKVISPKAAAELLATTDPAARPVLLDTRGGYKDYFRGHIPGAHHIKFETLRGTDQGVPVQYLPDDLTAALLMRAGIQSGRTHLIYATGAALPNDEVLSASMVAFVLEKFGVEDIRIIDGGLPGWQSAGLPVSQEYFGNPVGTLPVRRCPEIGIALPELLTIKSQPGVILVDARPHNEYLGKDDVWLRKGHIPGAVSFHWAKLMETDNTHKFIDPDKARQLLERAGITPNKRVIVYCGTSREGSLLRFYLRHVAGYPDVRLYEGSWKEYASMKQYPAETKENKVQ